MGKIIKVPMNPTLTGMSEVKPDIIFSKVDGHELKLTLVTPWRIGQDDERRFPLVMFIQGSGFTFPNINYELPALCRLSQMGYVVATVTHRNCMDGYPFPAYLQDVKTAIRFLRANKDTYMIDPERVACWGTSSGGNTAMMLGLTGDDPVYKTDEYREESDAVIAAVDCFGPVDILSRIEAAGTIPERYLKLLGDPEKPEFLERAKAMSPQQIIREGAGYPPFLLLHGDDDKAVSYSQSENLFNKLNAMGYDTDLICVEGAPHEHTFWSVRVQDIIFDFLIKNLKII
jgi:acetyl esterase/lipase